MSLYRPTVQHVIQSVYNVGDFTDIYSYIYIESRLTDVCLLSFPIKPLQFLGCFLTYICVQLCGIVRLLSSRPRGCCQTVSLSDRVGPGFTTSWKWQQVYWGHYVGCPLTSLWSPRTSTVKEMEWIQWGITFMMEVTWWDEYVYYGRDPVFVFIVLLIKLCYLVFNKPTILYNHRSIHNVLSIGSERLH